MRGLETCCELHLHIHLDPGTECGDVSDSQRERPCVPPKQECELERRQ